jgi:hypothetical protein
MTVSAQSWLRFYFPHSSGPHVAKDAAYLQQKHSAPDDRLMEIERLAAPA